MRIDMVSEHASPLATLGGVDAGGQNVHVAALAEQLARRGHTVRVYTRRDAPPERLPERRNLCRGVEVVHVPVGPPEPLAKDELYPLMDEFGRWLELDWRRHGRPDVVHAHFWMSGLASLQAGRAVGVPVALTFHALGSVKRRHQGAADTSPDVRIGHERALAASVDLVVATCTDEVEELRAMGGPLAPVQVIPCGVDTDLFRPGPSPTDEPESRMVLAVGRMVERKGFDTVVAALAEVPDATLVVVGGPPAERLPRDPEARRLQEVARCNGVEDRVHLVGGLAHDQLPALYRSAQVVVSTPWYEPFGITPVEAAACGRPFVGSAVGGLLDTVQDRRTGLLVPPHDPSAVAAALRELLDNPQWSARLGERAARRARATYAWPHVARRTEEALARAVELAAANRRERAAVSGGSRSWLRSHSREVREGLADATRQSERVESWGRRLAAHLGSGGRLLAAGNGGSAAEAEHLTGELVGRFLDDRRPLSAVSLASDVASLTAILNDYGPEEVFARQVGAHGRPGDVLVLLSTSGRSPNMLAAARRGRELGLRVWAMTGPGPNPLEALADEAITVAAGSTAAVQEVHLALVHAVCAALDEALVELDEGQEAVADTVTRRELPA
jgi:glycosyltransferase involved in cell wall biosynthesis/phosphoheptose isomerase